MKNKQLHRTHYKKVGGDTRAASHAHCWTRTARVIEQRPLPCLASRLTGAAAPRPAPPTTPITPPCNTSRGSMTPCNGGSGTEHHHSGTTIPDQRWMEFVAEVCATMTSISQDPRLSDFIFLNLTSLFPLYPPFFPLFFLPSSPFLSLNPSTPESFPTRT